MMDTKRGNNWIKFFNDDTGYATPDEVELIADSEGGSIEIDGECSGSAMICLSREQLKSLRDFLQEIL